MKTSNDELQVLLKLRDSVRCDEGGGGCCHLVADEIEALFGWPRLSGTYTSEAGEVICSAHVWNVLPDGAVLDATADQFGETDGIRIAEPGSLAHQRYRLEWYEDYNPRTHPNTPQPLGTWSGELDGDQQSRLRSERGAAWWLADKSLWQKYCATQEELSSTYSCNQSECALQERPIN